MCTWEKLPAAFLLDAKPLQPNEIRPKPAKSALPNEIRPKRTFQRDLMADARLLADTEQLRNDADVLDSWADCAERAGGQMAVIRRAAAAMREVAYIYSLGNPVPLVETTAPELLTEEAKAA